MSMPPTSNRLQDFKNKGKDEDKMRRRRNQVTVELRKSKREEAILKRRNMSALDSIAEEPLVEAAADSSKDQQLLSAVQAVRKLFSDSASSESHPRINDLIKNGSLKMLLECLKRHDIPMLQFEAAWTLSNIASGTSEATKEVVAAGAVPLLLQLMSSPDLNVCEQAAWALGSIIGDGPELRDHVIEHGVVQLLVAIVKQDTPLTFLHTVSWVFLNLCHKKPPPPTTAIMEMLPTLCILMDHTDTIVLKETAWAISYLTDASRDQIQLVIDSGVVPKLVALLGHVDAEVQLAALRAVGNIVTGSNEQTQVVLNYEALAYIPPLVSHANQKIREDAVWFLSNITAGNQMQVQAVIDAGLLPKVIQNLGKGVGLKMQKDAAWTIHNLSFTGNRKQVLTSIKAGAIPPFCNLLASQDLEIIRVVLQGLHNMLNNAQNRVQDVANLIEECGGLDKIEKLQNHENVEIYKLAYDILEQYFADEVEAADPVPASDGSQYKFDPDAEMPMNYEF